jgi:large-conductance mechanosensitive channel
VVVALFSRKLLNPLVTANNNKKSNSKRSSWAALGLSCQQEITNCINKLFLITAAVITARSTVTAANFNFLCMPMIAFFMARMMQVAKQEMASSNLRTTAAKHKIPKQMTTNYCDNISSNSLITVIRMWANSNSFKEDIQTVRQTPNFLSRKFTTNLLVYCSFLRFGQYCKR